MNGEELVAKFTEIQEYYRDAVAYQADGNSEAAVSRLIDADETIAPLIAAAKSERLSFFGSFLPLAGKTVGERIALLRERFDFSPYQLLRVMDRPACHDGWLSKVEIGTRRPTVFDLKKIARHFRISMDELVP